MEDRNLQQEQQTLDPAVSSCLKQR